MNNTNIVSLLGSCDRDIDLKIFVEFMWRSQLGSMITSIIMLMLVGEAMHRFPINLVALFSVLFALIMGVIFGCVRLDGHVIWVGGAIQGLVVGGIVALTTITVETYGTTLR